MPFTTCAQPCGFTSEEYPKAWINICSKVKELKVTLGMFVEKRKNITKINNQNMD